MVNFIAEVAMELQYLNKADCPIDIKRHHLPIEQGAAVVECTAKIDGDIIEMKVKEELTAKQEMHDEGRSVILVEQLNQDSLGISINKLLPHNEAIVTIKFAIELPVNGAVTRLTIPTTISPIVPLEVDLLIIIEDRINSLSSPSHSVKSKSVMQGSSSGEALFVKSKQAVETKRQTIFCGQTEKDFIAEIQCNDPNRPMVFVENGQDGGDDDDDDTIVILSFVPSFDVEQVPKEVIYLADMSPKTQEERSSFGSSLGIVHSFISNYPPQQKTSPERISEGCFFNVVNFGKHSNPLFPNGSVAYSSEAVEKAVGVIRTRKHIEMVGKDLHGTLEHILKQRLKNGLPRQVVLIIRNEVIALESILKLTRQNAHNTQIFCYGMESVASKSVIRRIARAGGGTAEFKSAEHRETSIEKESFLPQLKGLKVSWKDGESLSGWERFPEIENLDSLSCISLPSYRGNRLSVIGKFPASKVPVSCIITSENTADMASSKSLVSDEMKISEDETLKFSSNSLHRFVGRKLIRELEKRESCGHDMKERIIKVALKDQLISKFTSFVGKSKEYNQ